MQFDLAVYEYRTDRWIEYYDAVSAEDAEILYQFLLVNFPDRREYHVSKIQTLEAETK